MEKKESAPEGNVSDQTEKETSGLSRKELEEYLKHRSAEGPSKGDKGDPGIPGIPGRNGLDGKDGKDGLDGKDASPALVRQMVGEELAKKPFSVLGLSGWPLIIGTLAIVVATVCLSAVWLIR